LKIVPKIWAMRRPVNSLGLTAPINLVA